MYRKLILTLFCNYIFSHTFSQVPGNWITPIDISPSDSQKIHLSLKGSGFLKNNEYFNPIDPGYTLIGYYLEPTLKIQLTKDFKMESGIGMLKYSGRNGFFFSEPVFRLQYQPNANFQMVLGTIFGGISHKLIEPLYRWENVFSNPLENGVQFLFNYSKWYSDIWLNWEKFITHGDPFQEELTVGISSEFYINDRNSDLVLSVPVQGLAKHKGGQIISIDTSLVTITNWATGLKLNKTFNNSLIKFWRAELYYVGYADLSPQKNQLYKNGYGIFPVSSFGLGNFSMGLGYFMGTRFMSPIGEKLLHSGTIPNSNISQEYKNVITGKFWYNKTISTGIILGAYLETYTDFKNSKTDYAYGVHILMNQDFFLLKYKPGNHQ